MVSDVNRMGPRAYLHRQKLHEKPTGWTALGPLEVCRIMDKVSKMVMDGEDTKDVSTKTLFRAKPHTTSDKYVSGALVMEWLGQNRLGVTITCRRDRLPSWVPNQYLHFFKQIQGPYLRRPVSMSPSTW